MFGTTYSTVDIAHDPTKLKSSQILSSSVNNHFWVGGLSQFDYKLNSIFGVGIDEQSSLVITKNNMFSRGAVYFYQVSALINQTAQNGRLNYGPIKRLDLVEKKIISYFHFDFNYGL